MTQSIVGRFKEKVLKGDFLSFEEILELNNKADFTELCEAANEIREKFCGNEFDLCTIANAKSGKCTEDCKFCSQSLHYSTGVDEYDIINEEEALQLAKENDENGVNKFSLVTSGRAVNDKVLDNLCKIFSKIKQQTKLHTCASMGLINKDQAQKLVDVGVEHYHCNLETGPNYFEKICTTHSYQEKLKAIQDAKEAGLEICSGGIIGLGETMIDRIEMAFELRLLEVKSIPLNILNPIEGTPFYGNKSVSRKEVIKTIAIFRFIIPDAKLRFAGGRMLLGDKQEDALRAGINAALTGDYLTTTGFKTKQDIDNFKKMGFQIRPNY